MEKSISYVISVPTYQSKTRVQRLVFGKGGEWFSGNKDYQSYKENYFGFSWYGDFKLYRFGSVSLETVKKDYENKMEFVVVSVDEFEQILPKLFVEKRAKDLKKDFQL